MSILVILVCLVILQLVQTHIDRFDRVDREQFYDVFLVLLDCQGKRLFKLEVQSVGFLHELDAAFWAIPLHPLNKHIGLLTSILNLIIGSLGIACVLALLG